MQIGIVGLGRMGAAIARRLMRAGHSCVVYDRDAKAVDAVARDGAEGARDLADLAGKLEAPRTAWVMLPAGAATDATIAELGGLLSAGDAVVDGGNSFFRDDICRAKALSEKGIDYVDAGVSGGVWGLERGFCLMVGGSQTLVARLDPIFQALAPGLGDAPRTRRPPDANPTAELGYIHAGPVGAGHFVKMIHNGIEYGLMQAYAEGFDILKGRADARIAADERFDLDLAAVAEVWRRGSVISSWLLDLSAQALADEPDLDKFQGAVDDSGEGRWTVEMAIEQAVPADVLSAALFARFRSRQAHTFGDRLLSALRHAFGGHVEGAGAK